MVKIVSNKEWRETWLKEAPKIERSRPADSNLEAFARRSHGGGR